MRTATDPSNDLRSCSCRLNTLRWSLMAQAVLFVVLAISHGEAMAMSVPRPTTLTTEHASTPADVDTHRPRFGWQLDGNVMQRGYQIVVGTEPSGPASGRGDVWDSGMVVSPAQTDVEYAGPALQANTTYFWAVRVSTTAGQASVWSKAAQFETGLFSPSDWSATWIGRDNPASTPTHGAQPSAPLLRKEFTLAQSVARARLRIVGLGYYVAFVNGRRVGDQVLDPAPSVFDITALYATHDVTKLLRRGQNALGVTLGRGYFGAPQATDLFAMTVVPWHSEPRLLAQLDVTYRDGSSTRIVSDGSWTLGDGPIKDSIRIGEQYDARLERAGWTKVGFDDAAWSAAPVQTAPAPNVVAMAMEPIRNTDSLRPVSSSTPKPGVTVYDFGRTIAGWAAISVRGGAGTTLTLAYGETLNQDGTVSRLFGSHHIDSYTPSGSGRENWEPSFARHGFRYIEVSSAPVAPTSFRIRARVNHNDLRSTGRFRSGSDILNRLQENQRASILANMWGFPTDTPWRDRMGWTADAWLYLDSAAFNFDVHRLFVQWLRSYRDSQEADGSLPIVVPSIPIGTGRDNNDPSWSGSIVLTVWGLYQHYGDTRVLADNYDAMARWMDLMQVTVAGTGNIHRGFSFGDWASPGAEANGSPFLAPPEGPALTATADLYHEARTLARIAELLGRPSDVATYDAFAADVRSAFNATFFDAAANVYRTEVNAGYRQTSNLMPLAYGLVPADRVDPVYANLVADIRDRGNHLNTGAIGTKQILPVLTARGDIDLAYAVATQTTYPSWGYWLDQGATSSWETWSHTGALQSQNHAFLGTFDDWLYRDLAGIQSTSPGYASIRIRPAVPADLANASATVDTPRGEIVSEWRQSSGKLALKVSVPANTSAEVHVPAAPDEAVQVKGDGGVDPLSREDRYAVFTAPPGTHVFEVRR
jgi:hypothetical protein